MPGRNFSVYFPDEVFEALQSAVADSGMKRNAFVQKMVREYIAGAWEKDYNDRVKAEVDEKIGQAVLADRANREATVREVGRRITILLPANVFNSCPYAECPYASDPACSHAVDTAVSPPVGGSVENENP